MMTMEFQKALIGVGTSVFDLYLVSIIYGVSWKKQINSSALRAFFCLFFIAGWFFIDMIPYYSPHFFCGWGIYFLYSLFYQSNIRERLLLSCVYMFIVISIEYTVGFLLSSLLDVDFEIMLQTKIIFYLCGAVISKLILFIIAKGFEFFHKHKLDGLSLKGIFPLLAFPLTSIIIGLTIMEISPAINARKMEIPVAAVFLFLTFSNIYFISVMERQANQEKIRQRLLFLEEQHHIQLVHYQELYEKQKTIRKTQHNMKNTLLAIWGMVRAGENEKALEHITTVLGKIKINSTFIQTGFPALDAVLSAKTTEFSNLDIPFSYQISISVLNVDEVDLCILIANALDNALEACRRLHEKSKAYIKLDIHTCGAYLLAGVENSALKPVDCITWKADRENHGLGLKSMQKIAKKYNGNIFSTYNQGVFYFSCMLNNG